jgi:Domain of unknown function (DUF4157)
MPEKTTIAARAGVEPAVRGALREAPTPAVVSMILGLQQANGNQAVGRLLGGSLLQARLRIGPQGDTYEREANRVADRILRDGSNSPIPISVAQASSRVQRQCHCQDDELLQRKCKCQEQEGEELLQPKRNGGSRRSSSGFDTRVNALRGGGRPLPDRVRGFFEPRFGHDFGAVRVHTGTAAGDAANAVGARAFTIGNDVVFGSGEWSPDTHGGKQLLAHELTHVVQQTPLVARRKPALEPAQDAVTESAPDGEGVTGPESAAPSPEPQAPEPSGDEPAVDAPGEAVPAASVVVDDDASEVSAGQMKKSEFLGRLLPEVCAAAEAGLSGTEHTAEGCPFIAFVFGYYEDKSSAQLNSDLPKFIEGSPPTTAEEYITRIAARVGAGVNVWARTGTITGVPRAVLVAAMQVPEIQQLRTQAAAHGIQFKARSGGARNPGNPAAVRDELGKGRSLDGSLRSRMESALGRSFGHVQVHTDGQAAALSHRFNARAFTIGNHVAFGAGEYRPGTLVGDALMAHELAHVAQQSGAAESVQPMGINDSSYGALERDADMAAVGAVASLWGMRIPSLRLPMRTTPRLSSGLRLQRCDCNGGQKTPATPTAPSATPAGPAKCCDFDSFTASNDSYSGANDCTKEIKFTFAMKPGADEKKCVLVNWVQGSAKTKSGAYAKAKVFDKMVDVNFPTSQIDSKDTDPVYWSDSSARWKYRSAGSGSFWATDNPGPATWPDGLNLDLTFKMCLYCIDDVSATSDVTGSGVKNPLKCIDWVFKSKYDAGTGKCAH